MLESIKYLLWGRKNPSWDWQANATIQPEFDLSNNRLCGVGLGDAIEGLAWLGRAPFGVKYALKYFQHGFEVDVEQDRVVGYTIFLGPSYWRDEKMGLYQGTFRVHGERCDLSVATTEADLTKLLGEPAEREADDDEILLTYRQKYAVQEFELTPAGQLQTIVLFDPN